MTWNDLTVGQYQRLYGILKQTDKTNLDILTEIISVCEGYAIDDDCVNALALAWAQFMEKKHDVKYVFI